MMLRFLHPITLGVVLLSACGGGGSPAPSTPNDSADNPFGLMSARLLADNAVQLTLNRLATASERYCIRQDSLAPEASDACFSGPSSTSVVHSQAIANPSNTQRAVFTAWVLSDNTVQRLARLSLPGRTCSAAAYASLATAASTLPAVCVLTGTGTALKESVVLLESDKAPNSTGNFLRYVNQSFYDQTVFHRFLKSSVNVVQGGGYVLNGSAYAVKPPTQTALALESTVSTGLSHTAGTIAMARTNEPDTATSQFFVNTTDNLGFDSTDLRNGYAVFGRFVHGLEGWAELLSSVSGGNEVTNPNPPVQLHWAYQIQ
jgi:peptidyl-prolyl cis-trans isomerase A (cyclophilin A)